MVGEDDQRPQRPLVASAIRAEGDLARGAGRKEHTRKPAVCAHSEEDLEYPFRLRFLGKARVKVGREAVCTKADCLCLGPPDNGMERSGGSEHVLRKGVGGANRFYDGTPLVNMEAEASDWEKTYATTDNEFGNRTRKGEEEFNNMRAAR